MTTPHNQPEPTELEKAIEHIENLRIAQRSPWSTIYCNMVSLGKVLSAAKRSQQAEQQLKDMTEVAKKLAEALSIYAKQEMWTDHIIDSHSGLCWFFDWDGDLQDKPYEVAEQAITLAKQANLL